MTQTEDSYLPWASEIRDEFARRACATFVLHDNIADLFPMGGAYLSCTEYLEAMLRKNDYIIIRYDVSRGMRFASDEDAKRFVALANQGRAPGEQLIESIYGFPREPTKALAFIEAYVVGAANESRPVALILEYAEHIAPNGDVQGMHEVDRINLVTLQRFSRLFYERLQDAESRDAVCFLTTPYLHGVHQDLTSSELVRCIGVPRPDWDMRLCYARWKQAKLLVEGAKALELELGEQQLAALTAGLTLTGIRHLFLQALHADDRRLTVDFVTRRKKELIERDSRGMLKILTPKHGLDAVGGNAAIKAFFAETARDLRNGQSDVPAGVICPGPNGVGKTFLAKAFARDCGINCVSLGNFRGMYVGQTEANLDIVFSILEAMTPNVVIIDEADKMLGNEVGGDTSGVDERVFGAFTAFMGNPEYRGRIFWLLLTARPFNLAPDTGRPGRVEEHVPILAPETFEDKSSILQAVTRGAHVELLGSDDGPPTTAQLEALFEKLGTVTPAALSLIAHRSRRRVRRAKDAQDPAGTLERVPIEVFAGEAAAYVGEGSEAKITLQTIEAVLYTNHLDYLPEPWRSRVAEDRDGLNQRRRELRRLVGYD